MVDQVLAEVLHARAHQAPDAVAYEYLDSSGRVDALTYAQVASRASALAEQLAAAGDGPVLQAYPAGLDYVVGVFAGFLAGRPVIPAFPPGLSSVPDRTRLSGIVADARPAAVLAAQEYAEFAGLATLTVPGAEADGTAWRTRRVAGDEVAIVQYTSGSTGHPRGVLVRHDSVAANTAVIVKRFALTADCRAVNWLPPFHDMGLVGGLLTPMAAGIPVRIMPPEVFLKAPLSWLRQITEAGATASGGPNFAYDLCVRRARRGEDALAGLDLSSWRVAFNGGEPVRLRTLIEFADTFAPAGFRAEAFLPCYGLAEATLMVSAGHWSRPTAGDGASSPASGSRRVVSCGTPVSDQRVTIVDPKRLAPVDDGEEGEIWVAGPHVTPGYLGGDAGDLFGYLDGIRCLRTGDLGRLHGGELSVTGRAKDVIVFRGANHHAVDVEAAALDAAGRSGAAAAFQVEGDDAEPQAVLVLETRTTPTRELADGVRAAVLARTRLPLASVILVPPRAIPRTSSGKIRRGECRARLLAGAYDGAVASDPAFLASLTRERVGTAVAAELADVICAIVATVHQADCRPTTSLPHLGLDSLRAAETAAVLEHALGLTVPLETVLTAPTPRTAAATLLTHWQAQGHTRDDIRERLTAAHDGTEVM